MSDDERIVHPEIIMVSIASLCGDGIVEVIRLMEGKEARTLLRHTDLVPMPINEDLLGVFGFERRGKASDTGRVYFTHKRSGFILQSDKAGSYTVAGHLGDDGMGCGIESFAFFCHIEHLHRLQNLYLELTGEELNVKS